MVSWAVSARIPSPVRIVALVVALIFAGLHARNPFSIRTIPIDRRLQALFKRHLGLPTGRAQQFCARESVPPVVARTVLNRLHQAFGFPEPRQKLSAYYDFRPHTPPADHMEFALAASLDRAQNRPAMIVD